ECGNTIRHPDRLTGHVRRGRSGAMNTPQSVTFGHLLRRYRQAAGLTQKALARNAHLSLNAIAALESGRRRWPHEDTVALLVEALQLSPDKRAQLQTAARLPSVRHHASPASSAPQPLSQPLPHSAAMTPAAFVTLPVPLTPLLGREREEAAAVHLLAREE